MSENKRRSQSDTASLLPQGRGLEPQAALDLNALFDQLGGIDLGKLHTEQERNKLTEKLAKDPTLHRVKKGKTGLGRTARPKKHWRHRRKAQRQWYEAVGKPRREERIAAALTTPDGWYEKVTYRWKQQGHAYFTYEEFLETFWPMIRDEHCLPTFRRYDTRTGGFTLDNVYVIDVRTGDVCWDSAEERLRSLGYAL